MNQLLLELQADDGSWVFAMAATAHNTPGSFSNNATGRREILQVRCDGDQFVVERSIGGADIELEGRAKRAVTTLGFDHLATLGAGDDPYEFELQSDRMDRAITARFRFQAAT